VLLLLLQHVLLLRCYKLLMLLLLLLMQYRLLVLLHLLLLQKGGHLAVAHFGWADVQAGARAAETGWRLAWVFCRHYMLVIRVLRIAVAAEAAQRGRQWRHGEGQMHSRRAALRRLQGHKTTRTATINIGRSKPTD
jgi:hypothetical protein